MRLIDADALRENMQWCIDHGMYDKPYDYLAEIDDAPTVCEWIPVGDKLPEIGKRVLVYVMGDKALLCFHEVRDSYIGVYMGDGRWGVWIYDGMRLLDSEDVLAWTPLPKPYKKGR